MSRSGDGADGAGAAGAFPAPDLFVFAPACPASRYGRTPVRSRFFAHTVAAMDTEPAARPNCASIAAWLDGIRPYCHRVAVRGAIPKEPPPATPNSSTRLAAWKAPQT